MTHDEVFEATQQLINQRIYERNHAMQTVDQELKAFCEGYLTALLANGDLVHYADDWVQWRDYDINLIGKEYAEQAGTGLYIAAYPAGWSESLPHPLFSFTVGE